MEIAPILKVRLDMKNGWNTISTEIASVRENRADMKNGGCTIKKEISSTMKIRRDVKKWVTNTGFHKNGLT